MKTKTLARHVFHPLLAAAILLTAGSVFAQERKETGSAAAGPGPGKQHITICHMAGNQPNTMTINSNALAAHLAHGDYQGECLPPSTAADLSVTKTCALTLPKTVLCTVTIKNIGQVSSAAPLTLTDTPTAAPGSLFSFWGSGPGFPLSCSGSNNVPVPANIPCTSTKSLAPGESVFALFSFAVTPGSTFKNCATVTQASNSGTQPDPNASNNTNICTTVIIPPSPAPSATISNLPMQGGTHTTPCPPLGIVLPRSTTTPAYLAIMLPNLDMQCGTKGPGFKLQTIKFLTCAPDSRGPGFGPNATADLTCGP